MKQLSIDYRVLAAAHDAGGANQLIHLLQSRPNTYFLLQGPAAVIGRNFDSLLHVDPKNFSINDYDCLVVSSNSQIRESDLLLKEARSQGIATVGILDHWVNYRSRWEINPDKVIATDFHAYLIGLLVFGSRIRFQKSVYLRTTLESVNKNLEIACSLLILLQPKTLEYNHATGQCICPQIPDLVYKLNPSQISLREHYATNATECVNKIRNDFPNILVHRSEPESRLELDLSKAAFVVGYDTYALYLSKRANKKTFTFGPKRRSFFGPRYRKLRIYHSSE
jgi:hypothetical protein